jgi:hypothetical protein
VEAPTPNDRKRERKNLIRVPLGTSAFKEGADVAGGEQITGRKKPKQKIDVARTDLERRKGNTPLGCSGRKS